jgi:hypothetical protein
VLVLCADDRERRIVEVLDRRSFTQELGVIDTPKSTPAFFPEASSRIGVTMLAVVPGSTVLRMTTTCQSLLSFSAAPISADTRRTYARSSPPFA